MRFKHLLRRLLGTPTFTAVVILTLAIGIGANTAIFSVIDGILLKPLPYHRPEELVAVDHVAPGVTKDPVGMAPFLYFTYREQGHSFQDIAMWQGDSLTITGLAEPERVDGVDFTDGMLPLLGVQPAAGRFFTRQDDAGDSPRTAVISYGFWQSKFGGNHSAIGSSMMVDGNSTQIIGVLPRDFWFFDRKPAMILPMRRDRSKVFLGNFSYRAVARLKSGVSAAQASADIARMIPISLHMFPPFPGYETSMFEKARLSANLKPLKQDVIGDIASILWVLMGTIGMVLLIACANVANLLLVRAEGRQQELAIRAALGAGWGQIVRELLSESLLLACLGGALGLGVAYGGLRLLLSLAPDNLPRLTQISIDGPVLLFTVAITLLSGVFFGLIPALKFAGPRLAQSLRAGGRTLSQSKERHRARNTLVVVQVSLAMVLLVASGLMIRTFYAMKQVDPGFVSAQVQTVRVSIEYAQVNDSVKVTHTQQEILEKVAALPGVVSVGLSSVLPMNDQGWSDPIYAKDKEYSSSELPPIRRFRFVSPGLFATLGNSLVAGRDFTWSDAFEKHKVVILTENTARELWGTPQAALGKWIRENTKAEWREVIGVINDQRNDGLNKPAPTAVYFPLLMDNFAGNATFTARGTSMVVRTSRAGSTALVDEIRKSVWSVNPSLPVANVSTLDEIVSKSMARTSFTLVMLAIAGSMALLLGVVGIYGVISYSVTQRTREIGIRMALGATIQKLTGMFVLNGLRLAAIGLACGIAAAVGLTRLMQDLLFGVKATDPVTYFAVAVGLTTSAMLASYIPAARTATVDPVDALRAE